MALRRDVHEAHPWMAQELCKAFEAARRDALLGLGETAALKRMLPWSAFHVEETREALGHDFWSYGLEPNRHVIDAFLRYSYEQRLSPRRLAPETLFAAETLESFVI